MFNVVKIQVATFKCVFIMAEIMPHQFPFDSRQTWHFPAAKMHRIERINSHNGPGVVLWPNGSRSLRALRLHLSSLHISSACNGSRNNYADWRIA